MKIIKNKLIPPKGFAYINLFGVLFTRKSTEISKVALRHETIHTKQMKELWYIPFYIIYVVEWLNKLIYYRDSHQAYRNIGFEREAYQHQGAKYYYFYCFSDPGSGWERSSPSLGYCLV